MGTSSPARRSQAAAPPADANWPGCTQQKFQPVWLSEASTHLGAVVQAGERVCIFHVPKPGKMSGTTGDWLCPLPSCGLDLSSPISEPQFLPQWALGSDPTTVFHLGSSGLRQALGSPGDSLTRHPPGASLLPGHAARPVTLPVIAAALWEGATSPQIILF